MPMHRLGSRPMQSLLRGRLSRPTNRLTAPRCLARAGRRYYSSASAAGNESYRVPRWLILPIAFAVGYGIGDAMILFFVAPSKPTLQQDAFSEFTVARKRDISPTSCVLSLRPILPGFISIRDGLWDRNIWSVEVTQPYMQIVRHYTPLPPFASSENPDDAIRLYIRREANGEMSNYLHKLPQAATVNLRVPATARYEIPEDVDEVLFLAGGTGIAPALQAAHALLKPRKEAEGTAAGPRMTVLWANRRREDCEGADVVAPQRSWWSPMWWTQLQGPPAAPKSSPTGTSPSPIVQELDHLRTNFDGRFNVQYFVDEENRFITPKTLSSHLISGNETENKSSGKRLILISGPDGFVAHFAGPKLWRNGQETQGPLEGLLSQLKVHGWEVFKL